MTGPGLMLGLSGTVQLEDGRWISAEIVTEGASAGPAPPTIVEIDAEGLGGLHVRFSRPGDRFGALGAPGHKPVRRFMGERGVPREERSNVPLVVHGDEVVWVAGIEIADRYKVQPSTKRRVRLSLGGARGS